MMKPYGVPSSPGPVPDCLSQASAGSLARRGLQAGTTITLPRLAPAWAPFPKHPGRGDHPGVEGPCTQWVEAPLSTGPQLSCSAGVWGPPAPAPTSVTSL